MNKNGFTLIELIMIIVLVGVVFPLILAPFLTSAKEVSTPAYISQLTMLAKGVMEEEIEDARQPGNFLPNPKGVFPTDYSTTPPTGVGATITREYCDYNDIAKSFTCPAGSATSYLNITVQVQDTAGNGPLIELQALKVKDY